MWLIEIFEPSTRAEPPQSRLLVMDGHSSHITANMIAFCIDKDIDILILPAHTSHLLQPLDVSIFSSLKRALGVETDIASRLDSGRIPGVEWTGMYIRARDQAFTIRTIESGWRTTGLYPLSPIEVLQKLEQPIQTPLPRQPISDPNNPLDLSLLDNSPPEGTELQHANNLLRSELRKKTALLSPARRYTERVLNRGEMDRAENIILRKRLLDAEALLKTRKERKKGKRVT